jgi:hypothetical protein
MVGNIATSLMFRLNRRPMPSRISRAQSAALFGLGVWNAVTMQPSRTLRRARRYVVRGSGGLFRIIERELKAVQLMKTFIGPHLRVLTRR